MPDLDELFAEAEAEYSDNSNVVDDGEADVGEAVQADQPVSESADVVEGDEGAENDNPDDDGIVEEAFDWEAYAEQLVPVGDDSVSLRELRDGYLRQSDYTRKTQSLAEKGKMAEWAESVQAAFDRDPAGTLEAFARAYGLTGQQEQEQQVSSLDDLDEDVRPYAQQTLQAQQELAKMQQRMEQIENQRIQDEVRAEIRGLQTRYGDDFDPEQTLRVAASFNVGLEQAHAMLMGQKAIQSKQTQSEASSVADKAAADAAAAAEKQRQAAKKRASNASTGSFKASDIPVDNFNDIGELMEQIIASGS